MYATVRIGAPERPWLLLVHGMLTSGRHWEPNLPALAAKFNLVRIDLPGHGRSRPPSDIADLTAANLVAGIDSLRERLAIPRWFICGQSFGAGLTLNYALRHPDRVIAQAFTNARVILRDHASPEEAGPRALRLARLRDEGRSALQSEHFHPRFARRFPPDLREMLCGEADRIDMACYIQILEDVMPALSLRHVADSAPKVPTLLVNGRHERAFQPVRDELAHLWPGLSVVDLDGGHSVNVENPSGFAAAVTGFFTAPAGRPALAAVPDASA